MEWLVELLPPALPVLTVIGLVALSFVTSAIAASFGLGGGVTLIAVMAAVMPGSAVVPVHGVVQLGSNVGRALVQIRHIDWTIALLYALGATAGAALGGSIAVELPETALKLGIGLFLLWVVWGRPPRFHNLKKPAMAAAGFVSTLLSMFFGAAAPVTGAVLSTLGLSRHQFVANVAATAVTMHVFKILAFGFLGFAFGPWIGLIVMMIVSGFLGTLAGSHLLGRIDEALFRKGFKIVMTLLALNLVWQAASAFFRV